MNQDCSNKEYGNKAIDGVMTGIVESFSHTFGFITPDDSRMDDVFIHQSEIEPWRDGHKELKKGQKVKFGYIHKERRDGRKGVQAVNLEILREGIDVSKFQIQNHGQQNKRDNNDKNS